MYFAKSVYTYITYIHTYICDGQKVSNTEEEKTLLFVFLGSPKSQLATLGPEGRQKPTERKEGIITTSDSLGHIDGFANDQVE
jgi:hypothetical protein